MSFLFCASLMILFVSGSWYIEANQHIAHFKPGIVHIFVWFSIFYSEWDQWTIWNINEYTRFILVVKQWGKVTRIFFRSF